MAALVLALACLAQCPGGVCPAPTFPREAPLPSRVIYSTPSYAPAVVYQDLEPIYQPGNTGIVPPWFRQPTAYTYPPSPTIYQGYQYVPSHRLPLTATRVYAPRWYGASRCGPGGCP
jgi:hypothetical protein